MGTWILILVLVGPQGDAVQVESVATPFATWDACNSAGVEARGLPVLHKPGSSPWNRIDWTCVATGTLRDACREREAAREAALDALREAVRSAARQTNTQEPTP